MIGHDGIPPGKQEASLQDDGKDDGSVRAHASDEPSSTVPPPAVHTAVAVKQASSSSSLSSSPALPPPATGNVVPAAQPHDLDSEVLNSDDDDSDEAEEDINPDDAILCQYTRVSAKTL